VDNGMPGSGEGIIGEYTTSGATVNTSLVSGLDVPDGIAVVAPEPATTSLLSVAATAALLRRQPARMRYQGSANT
jgi:hypothetical protein